MFAASLQETIVDAMLSWREVDQHLHLHASAGEDLPARATRPILTERCSHVVRSSFRYPRTCSYCTILAEKTAIGS